MNYKTPGVYVEEIALFPPSVAPVATAIPAFIGHTSRIIDEEGATLINRPIRLSSLLEYSQVFGGPFNPDVYTVQVDPADFSILDINPGAGNRYLLYDILRHYFDNGGGPCYVVSVGDYDKDIEAGDPTKGFLGGLRAIKSVDEPTILVIPETVCLKQPDESPDYAQSGDVHKAMIDQCVLLQDRFAVLDLIAGNKSPGGSSGPIQEFRTAVGNMNLEYAAAYYPWLRTTYTRNIKFNQLSFIDNQATPVAIPDATLDTLTGDPALDALLTDLRPKLAENSRIYTKITSATINENNYRDIETIFNEMRKSIFEETTIAAIRPKFRDLIELVRDMALSFKSLESDPGNSTDLTELINGYKSDTELHSHIITLYEYEKNESVRDSVSLGRSLGDVESDFTSIDGDDWIGGVVLSTLGVDGTDYTNGGARTKAETAHSAARSANLTEPLAYISGKYISMVSNMLHISDQMEQLLFNIHPFFKKVFNQIRLQMSLLPPSGALVGVYASTDRSRGVWKAPANVSLRGVIAPTYKLTDREQENLNVHFTGKSINAIRSFAGRGILVWGARTLAGNDNEWRYINVRRFFIFAEESSKKATEPFVFEPNDANTWIRIKAMLENFMSGLWRQGALAGATPDQAFYVKVGLDETMTAQDILEGRLIVEIGLAVVRPAEFIILRFSHKMQES